MESIHAHRKKSKIFKKEVGFNRASNMLYLIQKADSNFLSNKIIVFERNAKFSDVAKLNFKNIVNRRGMATFNKVNGRMKVS